MKNIIAVSLMLIVGICFFLFGHAQALSATLTVTKTADTADGVCDADCSLREAIAAAITGDTIRFSSLFDAPQTITLSGNELVIDKDLSIVGPAADKLIVSGNSQSRAIRVPEFAQVELSGMTITGGNAGIGGGIFNEGTLTIDSCHVTGNTAGSGGGVGSLGYFSGSLAIRNSTISNNAAADRGGGVWFDAHVAFSVKNSTISGNTVSSVFGEGGGIWVRSNYGGPGVLIWNSTITDNYPGGVRAEVQSPGADAASSIIAANRNNSEYADVEGLFTHTGHNLIGNIGTADGLEPTFSNIVGDPIVQADPRLGPLAYNGGSTPTHALLTCSLAIDHGFNLVGSATDQRGAGFSRTVGAGTDIGAYELQTITPTFCNTGPPTIDAANVIVEQGTRGDCPTCTWFEIAQVDDPDGLFGLSVSGISGPLPDPANGVQLFHIRMSSVGVFSAQIAASCTASDANFTLMVRDRQFEDTDTLFVTVTPETTPPVIVLRTDSIIPFPNDHKYRSFPVYAFISSASDNCDANVNSGSVTIEKVTSDEAENLPGRSDGDTLDDIVISADCRSVQLRAERDGNADGRVYSVTFRVRDVAGNTTRAVRKVTVPLNQNGNPAVGSPSQYTIMGNCG